MPQRRDIIGFRGGLDLVSQPMLVPEGFVVAAENYEAAPAGYRRVDGYEVFDGRPAPHQATYAVLTFGSGSTAITAGQAVTGAISGATGIVLYTPTLDSGSWAGGDAAGTLVIYNDVGTFQSGENILVGGSPVAVTTSVSTRGGAATDAENTQYTQDAIEARRSAIQPVPGEGDIRGVHALGADVYAFRDATGGATMDIWKATSSGWTLATPTNRTLDFTSGNVAPSEGDVIQGATSGATATVERVVLQSGTWSGTAAGYLVLSGQTGTFVAESLNNTTTSATNIATIAGDSAAVTIPGGGRVRAIQHNFYGGPSTNRLYFVNGQGTAFEFDGSVLAPIRSGVPAAQDKPTHVGVHSNHLLLAHPGGQLSTSGTGKPLSFLSADGAVTFAVGQDVTNLLSSAKTATVITCVSKIAYLQGNDKADFVVQDVSSDSGAKADTAHMVGEPHFVDNYGVRALSAAQTFGNWAIGTVTQLVEPLFTGRRSTPIIAAFRVTDKAQYRVLWNDGVGLTIYFGRKNPECTLFSLGFTPAWAGSMLLSDGEERIFAGDANGNVYELDAGSSANGAKIEAFIRTPFYNQRAPYDEKRYHRVLLDVTNGGGGITLYGSANVSYGDPDQPVVPEQQKDLFGGGGIWDTSFWDLFSWDSPLQVTATLEMEAIGTGLSLVIASDSTYEAPHTIASMSIQYTPRRRLR
ncbi:MAG: hypothetical protein D6688_10260 [Alphaproteobacteria bacterium]|nr:MAG: hypothetical protein D6688_10260 [Alphaproteobacteria bacterium]